MNSETCTGEAVPRGGSRAAGRSSGRKWSERRGRAEASGELRLKRKLTQADVAARSGLLQHHISQLENGVGTPTIATMLKLAAAIGSKPADLLRVFNGIDLSAPAVLR